MIDYYDVLNVRLDADVEEIEKAFKKASLATHPDKVNAGNSSAKDRETAAERFNEVMLAREVLKDVERRKVYDTFGFDLGEERPEKEVWNIGMSTMLSPLGGFLLQTTVARFALWLISFRYLAYLLILIGVVVLVLYVLKFNRFGIDIRDPELLPLLLNVAIVDAVVFLNWIWPLLSDTVVVMYLVAEVCGLQLFVESRKIGICAAIGSIVFAWLTRGWWLWILGFQVLIGFILLVALMVAHGIMRMWIDNLQAQRGEKVRLYRENMRKERKRLVDEEQDLRKKVDRLREEIAELKRKCNPAAAEQVGGSSASRR